MVSQFVEIKPRDTGEQEELEKKKNDLSNKNKTYEAVNSKNKQNLRRTGQGVKHAQWQTADGLWV